LLFDVKVEEEVIRAVEENDDLRLSKEMEDRARGWRLTSSKPYLFFLSF
jgi:hypothetical protein